MREPMTWSIPLFRAFGITVRLHLLYILITLALVWRILYINPDAWFDVIAMFVGMLFVAVVLHEFGHCFAARAVGGDAEEILIWPLGGLAYCDVPPNPRSNLIVAASGPAVNLGLALGCGLIIVICSYIPPFNPLTNPYYPELHNYQTGNDALSPGMTRWVDEKGNPVDGPRFPFQDRRYVLTEEDKEPTQVFVDQKAEVMPAGVMWLTRFFWLNWVLFLFNLLPSFPLDGGRILQALIWGRTDYRQGTTVAIYAGYACAVLMALIAFIGGGVLVFALALFIYVTCRQMQFLLENGLEESPYGDFSQGYTSLEREHQAEERQRKRRPNLIRRWLQRRAARRLQREHEIRVAEEQRTDELLAKIANHGRDSLTEEEKRFLDRVSARYRNNQS